jgi:hypothetical protein
LEVSDRGLEGDEFVSSIEVFVEPGCCQHSSIEGCAIFFANLVPGFWSATHPDLKRKIEKIVRDRAHLKFCWAVNNPEQTDEGRVNLADNHIQEMLMFSPEFYGVKAMKKSKEKLFQEKVGNLQKTLDLLRESVGLCTNCGRPLDNHRDPTSCYENLKG